jgi:hypothetical protein
VRPDAPGRHHHSDLAASGSWPGVGGSTAYPTFTSLSAVEAYDPASNTWTKRPSMPTARGYMAAAAVNGVLYALGGHSGGEAVATNEAYLP